MLARLMGKRSRHASRHVIAPEALIARQSTDILTSSDPDMTRAIRFVREHACDPISVEDVLRITPVSRSTLEKRFPASLGRTVHAEIQRVRMERARHLVAETHTPLKQVGTMIGVKQRTYFTVVFRQHFGCTPAQYRKKS